MEFLLLKMISKDLRINAWRFKEDMAVTEAMLRFSVHSYRESVLSACRDILISASDDGDKQTKVIECEFVFSLARKLGVPSFSIFSDCWQRFLSCQELQQLVVMVADKARDDETTWTLAPELAKIIEEFYDARLFHDEDSCLLLMKYLKPTDVQYARIVETIVQNAEHYHAGALLHLAQIQAGNRQSRKEVMDTNIFATITKAFENLSGMPSANILDYIDWVFSMCTSNRREPSRSPFYVKMISLICKNSRAHHEILLRILQRVGSHGSLMKHSTVADLGVALVTRYREYFVGRFRECGHAAYAVIISEMQRARLECRHYVKSGEVMFDSEVIDVIKRTHPTKKKLMKLLSVDFPEHPKPVSL